jgi:hypothetical protein
VGGGGLLAVPVEVGAVGRVLVGGLGADVPVLGTTVVATTVVTTVAVGTTVVGTG